MKFLNGRELADFVKERQFLEVRSLSKKPKLLIIRDSDNPVILKYVNLKKEYGEDIGVEVEDYLVRALYYNYYRDSISGIIIQLPIIERYKTY